MSDINLLVTIWFVQCASQGYLHITKIIKPSNAHYASWPYKDWNVHTPEVRNKCTTIFWLAPTASKDANSYSLKQSNAIQTYVCLQSWHNLLKMCCSWKYPYPPPPPLKIVAVVTPPFLLSISNDLPWTEHGYFLQPNNVKLPQQLWSLLYSWHDKRKSGKIQWVCPKDILAWIAVAQNAPSCTLRCTFRTTRLQ